MGKYEGDARQLLNLIGGKDNIKAVTHCVTRMRFVLLDPKQAQTSEIETIPTVKGTFTQAGQYQVIIGNDVAEFYKDFTAISGIEGVSKDEVKAAAKTNQNIAQKIMGTLGEIFAPLIPALVCGGLILGFRNVIGEINFFTDSGAFDLMNGTQSLADIHQFWAGAYNFLWLIGEAVFHMLPVGICWSITRKMGTTQILGIVLGLTLVSPQLLNGFAVAGTAPADIPVWDFGFDQVRMIGYQGQVIAAMMAAFVLVYLERFFKKVCPEVISMIVVPLFSLLPAVIIAHTIVGPIGWTIGNWIGGVVYAGLFSPWRILFAAAFGLLYAPVVMTGLHHMTNAVDTQLTTQYGGTPLWPMIALSNIAQGSAVLGMSVLQKKNERAQQVNVPALISCYLGVTEPALFGVNLKYRFPLICGMVGSATAAVISVGFGVEAASIGVGGLPGILSIKPQFWGIFLLAMAAAIVIPFISTIIVGKARLSKVDLLGAEAVIAAADTRADDSNTDGTAHVNGAAEATPAAAPTTPAVESNPDYATAILDGAVISLDEVPDEVFSQRIVGDGVAFEPASTTVVAPANATVSVLMGHAVGLSLSNGMELLIHIGVDTVSMNGQGFTSHVAVGDTVRAGQPLITFDPEAIRAAGHPTTTMLIVTNPNGKEPVMHSGMAAIAGETEVISW